MAELCRLINGGAEFNLDGIDAKPVLFHDARNNLPLVVKRLFDAGLDLNITDDEGKTALIYAIGNHSVDALCKLIECDADLSWMKLMQKLSCSTLLNMIIPEQ